jgi:hypothetical protein
MFQDEARFGRISDTRRCWCPKPVRPLCLARVTQEYTYAYGAVSVTDGQLEQALHDMELDLERVRFIVAWPWIINSHPN